MSAATSPISGNPYPIGGAMSAESIIVKKIKYIAGEDSEFLAKDILADLADDGWILRHSDELDEQGDEPFTKPDWLRLPAVDKPAGMHISELTFPLYLRTPRLDELRNDAAETLISAIFNKSGSLSAEAVRAQTAYTVAVMQRELLIAQRGIPSTGHVCGDGCSCQ
jgi:hypothetical protein